MSTAIDDPISALAGPEAERLAELMQALASPMRLRIIDHLRGGPCSVTEMGDVLASNQATLSNHLRILRHLGLVVGTRNGRRVLYSLSDEHVAIVIQQARIHMLHTE